MPNKSFKISRNRKRSSIWPVLVLIAVAIALALLVSGAWQMAEGKPFFPLSGDMLPAPSLKSQAGKTTSSSSSLSSSSSISSSTENSSNSSSKTQESKKESALPLFEDAVPKSPAVEQSYFDDAVFVGDSITEGMLLYMGMENAKILAGTGINFSTIATSAVIKNPETGARSTIMDELAKAQYKKVYIMLGGNEVRDMPKDRFLSRYEKVLDEIIKLQPDAIFYVQSMTPVTEVNNYKMDNKRIDEFNATILEMCKRKKLYFLNVAECMKDDKGMLPTEASPKDGMHFGQEYFDKWFAYLKVHTVKSTE